MRRRNSRRKRRGEEKEMNVEEKQREGGVQREPQLSARQHSTSQPVNYHHVQMQAGQGRSPNSMATYTHLQLCLMV